MLEALSVRISICGDSFVEVEGHCDGNLFGLVDCVSLWLRSNVDVGGSLCL
jgi:hypothetical protein